MYTSFFPFVPSVQDLTLSSPINEKIVTLHLSPLPIANIFNTAQMFKTISSYLFRHHGHLSSLLNGLCFYAL